MNFTQAKTDLEQVIIFLKDTGQFPSSYHKVIDALLRRIDAQVVIENHTQNRAQPCAQPGAQS